MNPKELKVTNWNLRNKAHCLTKKGQPVRWEENLKQTTQTSLTNKNCNLIIKKQAMTMILRSLQ